jgi:hypothetical protein
VHVDCSRVARFSRWIKKSLTNNIILLKKENMFNHITTWENVSRWAAWVVSCWTWPDGGQGSVRNSDLNQDQIVCTQASCQWCLDDRLYLSIKTTKSLFQLVTRAALTFKSSLYVTCGDKTKSNLRLVIGATLTVKGSLYHVAKENPLKWDLLEISQCVRSLGRKPSLIYGYFREIWGILQWFIACMTTCRASCFL